MRWPVLAPFLDPRPRARSRGPGVALALASLAIGCGGATSPSPAIPARAALLAELTVTMPRLATTMWALDAAAGVRNRDPHLREWLDLGNEEEPAWLAAYRERRDHWTESVRDDGTPRFLACALESETRETLDTCLAGVLSEDDLAIARAAIDEADRRIAPHWAPMQAQLEALVHAMRDGIASEDGQALLALLRHEATLGDAPLRFGVVLVATPDDELTRAQQVGTLLPCEIDTHAEAPTLLGIAYHEIAHLAHARSPERAAMDGAFVARGDEGVLAAAVWDEAVACAFGNGLAQARFDPAFVPAEESYYADPVIDRLGHVLQREWAEGADLVVGAALAAHLSELVEREVPASERPLDRYLWYTSFYAESVDVVRAGRPAGRRAFSGHAPVEDALPRDADLPPWAPRIAVLGAATLGERPALQATLGMSDADRTPPGGAAAVWRGRASDGSMVFAVVTRDEADGPRAAAAFVALPALPAEGWSELPL
ncbi:MAG: hypothetical protein U0234_13835 [Sandaracinus sp.]